jgi:hypothetical protein
MATHACKRDELAIGNAPIILAGEKRVNKKSLTITVFGEAAMERRMPPEARMYSRPNDT